MLLCQGLQDDPSSAPLCKTSLNLVTLCTTSPLERKAPTWTNPGRVAEVPLEYQDGGTTGFATQGWDSYTVLAESRYDTNQPTDRPTNN